MYPSHWSRDHRHHQEQQHRTIHRSPTPNRDSHLHERRKRRFDSEDDRPIHRGSRHKTSSSRSPPPSRKKSRFDNDKPLSPRPRPAASPPPMSADAARLFSILKEDSGRRLAPSMTSSVPERKEGRKLSSGDVREHGPHQASVERQYRPQSTAPATSRAGRVGVRASVSSGFGLPFEISTEKLRTRYLPSAIEVSERGSDSACYTTKGMDVREAAVSSSDLEDTTSKTAARTANVKYGFTLPRQAPMARRT